MRLKVRLERHTSSAHLRSLASWLEDQGLDVRGIKKTAGKEHVPQVTVDVQRDADLALLASALVSWLRRNRDAGPLSLSAKGFGRFVLTSDARQPEVLNGILGLFAGPPPGPDFPIDR